MKLTQSQIESMQEDMTSDILELLMDNNNMSMEQAMIYSIIRILSRVYKILKVDYIISL